MYIICNLYRTFILHLYHIYRRYLSIYIIHLTCIDDFPSCVTVQLNDELLEDWYHCAYIYREYSNREIIFKTTTILQSSVETRGFVVAGALEPENYELRRIEKELGPGAWPKHRGKRVWKRQMIMLHLVLLPRIYIQSVRPLYSLLSIHYSYWQDQLLHAVSE